MTKNHLYIDIHVLQTVPPSCVNRDDTGSPKTAQYGGVTRARVSSQSWKHAMREMFRVDFEESWTGDRTKAIVQKVAANIPGADAEKKAIDALVNAGLKIKDAEKGTDALFFMSDAQAVELAKLIIAGEKDKKVYKSALSSSPSIDMALFGRMVADDPSLSYDAAAQVAHSISTHAIHNEYDYFTAVDDCSPEDNAGAGHLGTNEFNAATLYRYATVNAVELQKTLGKDVSEVVKGFAESFIFSMPTGKQNSYANRTLPDMVYITVRCDQPVNMAGAFEKPVPACANGYMEKSEECFIKYAQETYKMFVSEPVCALGTDRTGKLETIADILSVNDLLEKLAETVSASL